MYGSFTPRASYGPVLRGTLYIPNLLFSWLNRSIILQSYLVKYDIFVWIFFRWITNDFRSMQTNTAIVWKIIIGSKYRLHCRLYRLHSQTKNRSDLLWRGIFFKTVAATVVIIIMCNAFIGHEFFVPNLTPDLGVQKSKNCVKNGRFKRAEPQHNRIEFNIFGCLLQAYFVTDENYLK